MSITVDTAWIANASGGLRSLSMGLPESLGPEPGGVGWQVSATAASDAAAEAVRALGVTREAFTGLAVSGESAAGGYDSTDQAAAVEAETLKWESQ